MSTLHHATKINAPRQRVYKALTERDEMARWHLGTVEGKITPGAVLTLTPKPGLRFSWRTDSLEPDVGIRQTCIEGAGTSPGKTLSFRLADAGDGLTVVSLRDDGWADDDPHMPFCNTHWGDVLNRLKHYVEQQ
ncbi:SRPBCC family protein [Pseudomonas massiliensis]|uniref:SRPBCC family protein n=1 Tax=Pseudomonas massiliensis TaxID=522492 RepID=UPI00058C9990|nr:SRPBCC domain-containing protein [Pseudomonas massiliensis]